MKVYVIKRALTKGIEVKDVRLTKNAPQHVYEGTGYTMAQNYKLGKDAFTTWAAAAEGAREMRVEKEALLREQLLHVRGLIFPSVEPKS